MNDTDDASTTASFQPNVDVTSASGPISVTAGDLDGDGKPDLAVALQAPDGAVLVMRNTTAAGAAPTFETCTLSAVNPNGVAIADFNGDGKPDLAVDNGGSTTNSFSIFLRD